MSKPQSYYENIHAINGTGLGDIEQEVGHAINRFQPPYGGRERCEDPRYLTEHQGQLYMKYPQLLEDDGNGWEGEAGL